MGALGAEEQAVLETVADWVDREVRPVARELEHANAYPEKLIGQLKELGIYGLAIPAPWGEAPVSMSCYALVTAELARGWMSLAGAMGGHTVVAKLLVAFGTAQQRDHYLPRMATGEIRATMALTEPGGGSDLQAMTTTARREGDQYVISGAKTWISNARRSQLIALLCKTDPDAVPRHRGMSILLVEHGPGLTVSRDLPKLGYKGIEACELIFDEYRAPSGALLGGTPGQGFAQMMRGLETGRIQVAARALGVAQAAFDDALRYAQQRESFGVPIWKHQAVGTYLADMATKVTAARQLILHAAEQFDSGQRSDLEAGMAKLFASEIAMQVALDAVRIHGGYGYSTEFDVERYFRDAPLMIVGEGTNEIQRNVIAAQLVKRGGLRRWLSGRLAGWPGWAGLAGWLGWAGRAGRAGLGWPGWPGWPVGRAAGGDDRGRPQPHRELTRHRIAPPEFSGPVGPPEPAPVGWPQGLAPCAGPRSRSQRATACQHRTYFHDREDFLSLSR